MLDLRRRQFIKLLGGATATWTLTALAQQPRSGQRVPHVGILNYAAAQDSLVDEFRSALRDLGASRDRASPSRIGGPTDD